MNSRSYKRFILAIFLVILAPAFLLSAGDAHAQKKTKKQQREKKPAAQAAAMPDAPEPKKIAAGAKNLEQSITASVKIDIAKFIKDAMISVSNKNPGQTVKLNITAQLASGSSEIMVFNYSERYDKPMSLKTEVSDKYPGPGYFTFESDYAGMKGIQIVSRPSASSYIDMIGYQVSTDAIIIGYTMADPKDADDENFVNIKPKISSEGAFYRQAADSAFAWKRYGAFNFYDTARLKKFKATPAFGEPMSVSTVGVEGKTANISIFAYKDSQAAAKFFPAIKLSKEVPAETAKNHKRDASYNYYLNDRFIIAISSR